MHERVNIQVRITSVFWIFLQENFPTKMRIPSWNGSSRKLIQNFKTGLIYRYPWCRMDRRWDDQCQGQDQERLYIILCGNNDSFLKEMLYLVLYDQEVLANYMVHYFIKWAKTSWAYSIPFFSISTQNSNRSLLLTNLKVLAADELAIN